LIDLSFAVRPNISALFGTRTRVIVYKYYIEVREEWVNPATFLMKCLYQVRKVSGHVYYRSEGGMG